MSPTATSVRPGCVGGGIGGAVPSGVGAGPAGVEAGGAPAQPASSATAIPAAAARRSIELFTDADQHPVELRGAQSRAQPVQLGEIADRADAHAVPDVVVDRDTLHVGVDTLLLELRRDAVGFLLLAIRARLQHVHARPRDGRGRVVTLARYLAVLLGYHHFEV